MLPLKKISISLKKLREQKSWSQEDLARQIGVSFATVNRWENGKTKPSKLAETQLVRLFSEATQGCDNFHITK